MQNYKRRNSSRHLRASALRGGRFLAMGVLKKEWNSGKLLNRATLVFATLAILISCGAVAKVAKKKIFKAKFAKISLNYQSATQGLNPNGTRFNPYEIVSDEVLEKASEELDYEISKNNVWISLPESGSSSSISTDYFLYCDSGDKEAILKAILNAWAEKFESTHTASEASLNYAEPSDDTDYIFLETWLESEANDLLSYAKTRLKADKTWVNSDNVGFQSVYDEIDNFINNDIAKYKTYIIENGITKDADTLKQTIAYKDKLLLNKKNSYDAQYDNRLAAIKLYDPTLFPTISVPSISSGTYYITTTKTGLDYIYDAASVASTNATDIQTTLNDDTQLVSNMKESGTDEKADATYESLINRLTELSDKLKNLDKQYKNEKEEPYFTILIDDESEGE